VIRRTALLVVLVLVLVSVACSPPHRVGLAAVWRWRPPPLGSVGMPSADHTNVAFTYGHLRLVMLDGAGHPRWEAERLGLRDVAPLLLAGRVIAATDHGMAAFDRRDGTRQWDVDLGDRANTPVPAGPNRLAVTMWDGRLLLLDVTTGAVVHTLTLPGDILGPAAAAPGVAVSSWDDGARAGVVAVDVDTGSVRWQHAVGADGVSSPAVVAGLAVVVTGDARAVAFDVTSGARRWARATPGAGSPEVPPLPGPEVVIADRLGNLVGVRPASGAVAWRTAGRGAAVRGGPAVAGPLVALPVDDGRVLIRRDGNVTVLDPRGRVSGVATGPGGVLLVATREMAQNELVAYRPG
jgi:outer membrane protein assembly factor BamB